MRRVLIKFMFLAVMVAIFVTSVNAESEVEVEPDIENLVISSPSIVNHVVVRETATAHKVSIVQRCRGEYVGETDNPFGKGLYSIYFEPTHFVLSNFINNSTTYSYEVELNPAIIPAPVDLDDAYNNSPAGNKWITVDDGAFTLVPAAAYGATFVITNGGDQIQLYDDTCIMASATFGGGTAWPWNGAGTGLVWNPYTGSFRVGAVTVAEWDAVNVGIYSFAGGLQNTHSGDYSGGWGEENIASGDWSGGWGFQNTFSGDYSGGWGWGNTFSGDRSGGWGRSNLVSGLSSGAIGLSNVVSGANSFTVGTSNEISDDNSVAFGEGNLVTSDYSMAMGVLNEVHGLASLAAGASLSITEEAEYSFAFGSDPAIIQLPEPDTFYAIVDQFIKADPDVLGAEKLTNGTFTGSAANWTLAAGWTYNANAVDKDGDGVGTLSQTAINMVTPPVANEIYLLTFTISNWTVGTVIPTVGGKGGAMVGEDGTYNQVILATGATGVVFLPTNPARFTIDSVSLKEITGGDMWVAGKIYAEGEELTPDTDTDNMAICWDDPDGTLMINFAVTTIVSPHCIPLTGTATYVGVYINQWTPDGGDIDTITFTLYVDGVAKDLWTTDAGVAGSYGGAVDEALVQGHYCEIKGQITGVVVGVDTITVQSAICNVEI